MQTSIDLKQSEISLTQSAGFVQLDNVGMIEIGGKDCKKHLHSFCTNEINKAGPGQVVEAFVLDVKGKTIGYVHLLIRESSVTCIALNDQNETLISHLDRYVIREDVSFTDVTADHSFFWLDGPSAAAFVQKQPGAPEDLHGPVHFHCELNGVATHIASAPLFSQTGFLVYCNAGNAEQIANGLVDAGITPCDPRSLELLRIRAALPAFAHEVTSNRLPQELCRDRQAISFVKGCYLGQETVARIDALGQVNWLLTKLEFQGHVTDTVGAEFKHQDKTIGHITSLHYSPLSDTTFALAIVRRGHEKPGTKLHTALYEWMVIE